MGVDLKLPPIYQERATDTGGKKEEKNNVFLGFRPLGRCDQWQQQQQQQQPW